jgi:hypothetical protein
LLQKIHIRTSSQVTAVFAYQFFGAEICVFTAAGEASQGSSINFAEEIAEAISAREGCNPFDVYFFDLQTARSYRGKPAGCFEFDHVQFKPYADLRGWIADKWEQYKCPQVIVEAFASYIGDNPRQFLRNAA